mgnify:CR=1 FL=1
MEEKESKSLDRMVHEIAEADFAMRDAMEDAGMEAEVYGIWGLIWKLTGKGKEREKHLVNKKKYIWLTILTGWMGGHRFYAKRYYLGAIYLVFFWTIIPFSMAALDILEVIPIKSDENGCILI